MPPDAATGDSSSHFEKGVAWKPAKAGTPDHVSGLGAVFGVPPLGRLLAKMRTGAQVRRVWGEVWFGPTLKEQSGEQTGIAADSTST